MFIDNILLLNIVDTIRIDTDNLIIGNGELIKNGSIVFEGNQIIYSGEIENAPNVKILDNVNTIMPGMWDCHGHYVGMNDLNFQNMIYTSDLVRAIRTSYDAQDTIMAGFTSVREVGGYGLYLKTAINEGTITGPRIYSAGSALSMTGGHGDIHSLPLEVMHNLMGNDHFWLHLVDGVENCLQGVRKQLRKGAEVIKIMVSGGVLSEIDHPIHQQFNFQEVKAIVDEAHRADLAVAAHCHGAPGFKNALDAGVDTIEHGTYLNNELADQMIEQDTILVPTRTIIEESMKMIESPSIPDYSKEKMKMTSKIHINALKLAIKKGVKIACGTDIAGSRLSSFNKWGSNAVELEHYVSAGMKPMDAIVTATGNAPKTLGGRAPQSGLLLKNYETDILLMNKNPIDDISILQDSSNFKRIIKSGKFIK